MNINIKVHSKYKTEKEQICILVKKEETM